MLVAGAFSIFSLRYGPPILTKYIQYPHVELCPTEHLFTVNLGLKALNLITTTNFGFVPYCKLVPEESVCVCVVLVCLLMRHLHPGVSGCRTRRLEFIYPFQ